jgi:hypothetical protein
MAYIQCETDVVPPIEPKVPRPEDLGPLVRVTGPKRARVKTMVWRTRLSWRSRDRSRRRLVTPEGSRDRWGAGETREGCLRTEAAFMLKTATLI